MWESGAQWAAPQHDLPVALLTAIAALGGGRGAMGSNRATAAQLQVGHVIVLILASAVDVYALARMRTEMTARRGGGLEQYATGRRVGQLGVALALVGKVVAFPISLVHARRVVWPGHTPPPD